MPNQKCFSLYLNENVRLRYLRSLLDLPMNDSVLFKVDDFPQFHFKQESDISLKMLYELVEDIIDDPREFIIEVVENKPVQSVKKPIAEESKSDAFD